MAIVETQNLTRNFGPVVAVNGMTIGVEAGEVFGLLGPNGAGKTTAIKILTTLLPPTSGRASVGGFDVVHQASKVRRVIGYVPQMLSADGALTGYENLLVFAKLYDLPRAERTERVHGALAFMGLDDAADKLVRSYSGGMIRRLEIAQSVLHHPKILFLDEPTVGLDPVARQAVWKHIEELRKNYGTTIILTTHLMEEADSLCGRVAIMHLGSVAAIGRPADLKASIKDSIAASTGGRDVTLDDVFIHFAGSDLESGGAQSGGTYRDASRARRKARRVG